MHNIRSYSKMHSEQLKMWEYLVLIVIYVHIQQNHIINLVTICFPASPVSQSGDPSEQTYELYSVQTVDPDIVSYLSRVQPFLLWYIDCACFVDTDDDRWSYFFM